MEGEQPQYIQEPLAIVGMACRFPGDTTSPSALWSLLASKSTTQSRIPADRFNVSAWYHPSTKRPGTMPVHGGYFINEDIRTFDPSFFGIREAEAEAMDPQHRKLMEVAFEAAESAGVTLDQLAGSTTGVYVANFTKDYGDVQTREAEYPSEYKWVGDTDTLLGNRISYTFDLNGPSMTINTACSGSLYALHAAACAIQGGECSAAFVGGANLILSPEQTMDISKSGVLSATSTCHTFDEAADGYARAEGIGCLYIKRLADAVRDGDPVRAVIRATATNANGRTSGITHPGKDGQKAVMAACYRRAGNLDPRETTYVECHGTGTKVGDPVEVSGIAEFFARPGQPPLLIGSVKTNIGHTEPTSGIAGVIKTVLALEKSVVPPNYGIKKLTSRIDWKGFNVVAPVEATPWPDHVSVRRASINSFGYGGSNAHAIIEAYDPALLDRIATLRYTQQQSSGSGTASTICTRPSFHGRSKGTIQNCDQVTMVVSIPLPIQNGKNRYPVAKRTWTSIWNFRHRNLVPKLTNWSATADVIQSSTSVRTKYLLCFSGHDERSMRSNRTALLSDISTSNTNLSDVAYTLGTRRTHFLARSFTVLGSPQLLTTALNGEFKEGKRQINQPRVAFVFTGQGAQWGGMGRELTLEFPEFRRTLAELDGILQSLDDAPNWRILGNAEPSDALSKESALTKHVIDIVETSQEISAAELSQPMCTALQIALVVLLKSWSVKPVATIGHSSGEIAAAFAAGYLTAQEAIVLAYYRGLAAAKASSMGAMLACGFGESDAEIYLDGYSLDQINVACVNSPSSVTLSGKKEIIEKLEKVIKVDGHFVRQVRTGGKAYHSSAMKAVGGWYVTKVMNALSGKKRQGWGSTMPERVKMMSTVTAKWVAYSLNLEYWRENMEGQVKFCQGASLLLKDSDVDCLVEVGPHSALAGPLRQIKSAIGQNNVEYAATLVRKEDSAVNMLSLVGSLYVAGYAVDLKTVNSDGSVPKVVTELPKYQWNHTSTYWEDNRYAKEFRFRTHLRHDVLGSRIPGATENPAIWRNILRVKDLPWMDDHKVGSGIVFPAAGFVAMAIEAATQLVENRNKQDIMSKLNRGMGGLKGNWFDVAAYELLHFKVKAALTFADEKDSVEVLLDMRRLEWSNSASTNEQYEFCILSYREAGGWSDNATGTLKLQKRDRNFKEAPRLAMAQDGQWRKMKPKKIYEHFNEVGLNYGPTFQGLSDIEIKSGVAKAQTSLVPTAELNLLGESRYWVHPATIDTCLQLSLASLHGELEKPYLPVFAEKITIYPDPYLQANPDAEKTATVVSSANITGLRSLQVNAQLISARGNLLLDIESFRCQSLDNAIAISKPNETRYPYSRSIWKPDISMLRQGDLPKLLAASADDEKAPQWFAEIDRLTLLCMVETAAQYPARIEPSEDDPAHLRHFKWRILECAKSATDIPISAAARQAEITELAQKLMDEGIMDAALVLRIFENMKQIMAQEVLTIDILMKDDLWSRFYVESLSYRGSNRQLEKAVDLLAHKEPAMKILEIGAGSGGATASILKVLGGANAFRRYDSYSFTDISVGYFSAAKERFSDMAAMEYKALNVEFDPTEQGFGAGEYDLVIASNVLHATPSLAKSLSNARKLLKPGGKLLLLEITRDYLLTTWVFGSFSGWWLGIDEGRTLGAPADKKKWQESLHLSGFSGIDLSFDDFPGPITTNSVMVSTAISEDSVAPPPAPAIQPDEEILILTRDTQRLPVAEALTALAAKAGYFVRILKLRDAASSVAAKVFMLADLDRPLLNDIEKKEFDALRNIASNTKSMYWITTGATVKCTRPENALSIGFTRTMRVEYQRLQLYLLDLEQAPFDANAIWGHFVTREKDGSENVELELGVQNGMSYIERVTPDEEVAERSKTQEEIQMVEWGSRKALRMGIETVGLFDSIYFRDDERVETPLGGEEVEVQIGAVGMNMKDVVNLMGHVDQTFFSVEGAGTVSRVGSAVTKVQPGDRAMCMGEGQYGTYKRMSMYHVQKIRQEDSLVEMATMPVVYSTVLYALNDIARLRKGESVLIHAAAGGVGIAAIQIARLIGAEIFATVGSPAKRKFLVEKLGIPEDRIFSSRDRSFRDDVMRATNGNGVDVVLNSTINELLHESFKSLSRFGRHVELGNRDIIDRGKLGLEGFDGTRSFTFFYLGDLLQYRPREVDRLLGEIMDLYESGKITPIRPIKTYDISQIEHAMRYFTEGKHIGKVVVTYDDPKAMVRYQPPLPKTLSLRSDASYLMVGGLGGLGRSLARRMYDLGARSFIFISPSGDSKPAAAAGVAHLRELGCHVSVHAGSAGDAEVVQRAIASAPSHLPVRGAMNISMVLRDAFLYRMTVEDIRAVLEPKTKATQVLHDALAGHDLDFFVVTSSISGGVIGLAAQANYAAGNSSIDAFCRFRRQNGQKGVSVNLGMIVDVGHVAESEGMEEYLKRWGLYGIDEDGFLRAMEVAMERDMDFDGQDGGEKAQLLLGLEPNRMQSILPTATVAWKSHARMSAITAAATRGTGAGPLTAGHRKDLLESVKEAVAAKGEANGRKALQDGILAKFAGVLTIDKDAVDVARPLSFYGMDSMVAAELRTWLWKECKADIPLLELLGSGCTVKSLGERVWKEMGV